MKQKITLVSLMLLIATFTSGQNASEKKHGLFSEKKAEKHLKAFGPEESRMNNRPIFRSNSFNAQSNHTKSAQITKQRLDSEIYQEWNKSTSQWLDYDKEEYVYDANGNMTQSIDYEWDESGSQWLFGWKEDYSYDSNGNLKIIIESEWDESASQWVADDEEENTYDVSGNLTQTNYLQWDESASQWVADEKAEFGYDANGNMTQSIYYEWDESASQWFSEAKEEYTYDAGNMTYYFDYYWDQSASQWVNRWKAEFSYDANDNMTQSISQEWDESVSQWVANWKEEYSYDANGNMTQFIDYVWNESISQWVDNEKGEYNYDANGNPILEIYSVVSGTAYSKYDYSYDLSYNLSDLILPPLDWFNPDYNEKIMNKPLEFVNYAWDIETEDWVSDSKGIYNYSESTVSVNNLKTPVLNLYPNPVIDNLTLNVSGNYNHIVFELFDLQGRKLMSNVVSNSENIKMGGFRSGLYFYILNLDGKKQSGKILKE